MTGSTTSSGIIFAKMQAEVAQQIGANAIQLVAANMAGGAIGKLISPQSIAVAIAAIGLAGADGKIKQQKHYDYKPMAVMLVASFLPGNLCGDLSGIRNRHGCISRAHGGSCRICCGSRDGGHVRCADQEAACGDHADAIVFSGKDDPFFILCCCCWEMVRLPI